MRKTLRIIKICTCLFFTSNTLYSQNNYSGQYAVPSFVTPTHAVLSFQLFVPQVDTIKGIYFYLGGGDMNTSTFPATNTTYRNLGTKHKFALLGAHLLGNTLPTMYYSTLQSWLGNAILDVVDSFAFVSNHIEIKNAPFFTEGQSNGGSFSYNFSMYLEHRAIGFFNLEGAVQDAIVNNSNLEIPGYILAGEIDNTQPINHVCRGFMNNRPNGAPLSYVMQPGLAHSRNTDTSFLFPYFREIVNLRLPSHTELGQPVQLNTIDQSKGWLGDNQTFYIAPDSCYYLDKRFASWFPTKAIAQKWQQMASASRVTAIMQCGSDSIQKPGYFGQKEPENVPKIFAPGLISVKGRNDFRFEMAADSSQAGFTSIVSRSSQPYTRLYEHFINGSTGYQRLFWNDSKWTFQTNNTDGSFLAGYSADYSKIFYTRSYSAMMLFTPANNLNFSASTVLPEFTIPAICPSFTKSGRIYFYDYQNSQVYFANPVGNRFDTPQKLPFPNVDYPYICKDESFLIYETNGNLYVRFRYSDTNWSDSISLGGNINTIFKETCPTLSPDGKYLFFSHADEPSGFRTWDTERRNLSNIYWVSASVIEAARLQMGIEQGVRVPKVGLYPNPASSFITLSNIPLHAKVTVHSIDGKLLMQQNVTENQMQININKLSKGVYLLKVESKHATLEQKFIKQ